MLLAAQAPIVPIAGEVGILLSVFILFYLDAVAVPVLPEVFAVGSFVLDPTVWFAASMLLTIVVAEISGFSTLYLSVRRFGLPKKVSKVARRYGDMLIVSDEKVILMNRIVPVLPFVGAFAALEGWDWKRCVLFTFIGCILKYGAILAIANIFYAYMTSDAAPIATIAMVVSVIGVSLALSYVRRRRMHPT